MNRGIGIVTRVKKCSCVAMFFFVMTYLLVWSFTEEPETKDKEKQQLEPKSHTLNDTDPNFPNPAIRGLLEGMFITFNDVGIYEYYDQNHVRLFSLGEKKWFTEVREEAARELSTLAGLPVESEHFLYGRYRWLTTGVEFDLIFTSPVKSAGVLRTTLFQPLSPIKVIQETVVPRNTVVNIIAAISGDITILETFIWDLKNHILKFDSHVSLTLICPGTAPIKKIQSILQVLMYPYFNDDTKIRIVISHEDKDPFHTAELTRYKEETSENMWDLLLLIDEELSLRSDLLIRCRANAIKGKQIYFPLQFTMYDHKIVDMVYEQMGMSVHDIEQNFGTFLTSSSKRATCMYRSDLATIRSIILAGGVFGDFPKKPKKEKALPKEPITIVYNNSRLRSVPVDDSQIGKFKSRFGLSEGPAGRLFLESKQRTFIGVNDLFESSKDIPHIKVLHALDPSLFESGNFIRNCSKRGHKLVAGRVPQTYKSCLLDRARTMGSREVLGLLYMKNVEGIDIDVLNGTTCKTLMALLLAGMFVLSIIVNIILARKIYKMNPKYFYWKITKNNLLTAG